MFRPLVRSVPVLPLRELTVNGVTRLGQGCIVSFQRIDGRDREPKKWSGAAHQPHLHAGAKFSWWSHRVHKAWHTGHKAVNMAFVAEGSGRGLLLIYSKEIVPTVEVPIEAHHETGVVGSRSKYIALARSPSQCLVLHAVDARGAPIACGKE